MGMAEWGIVAGIATPVIVGLAAIYAKLAILSVTVKQLGKSLMKIEDNHLPHIYARLGKMPCPTHEVRLTAIEKRIERE
ncbi:MAG TPA: hypothetical protein VMY42_12170 [Thermoguttaceae bacterium]|nr:hypothetical protein [Thermoguttaceae bacterium]